MSIFQKNARLLVLAMLPLLFLGTVGIFIFAGNPSKSPTAAAPLRSLVRSGRSLKSVPSSGLRESVLSSRSRHTTSTYKTSSSLSSSQAEPKPRTLRELRALLFARLRGSVRIWLPLLILLVVIAVGVTLAVLHFQHSPAATGDSGPSKTSPGSVVVPQGSNAPIIAWTVVGGVVLVGIGLLIVFLKKRTHSGGICGQNQTTDPLNGTEIYGPFYITNLNDTPNQVTTNPLDNAGGPRSNHEDPTGTGGGDVVLKVNTNSTSDPNATDGAPPPIVENNPDGNLDHPRRTSERQPHENPKDQLPNSVENPSLSKPTDVTNLSSVDGSRQQGHPKKKKKEKKEKKEAEIADPEYTYKEPSKSPGGAEEQKTPGEPGQPPPEHPDSPEERKNSTKLEPTPHEHPQGTSGGSDGSSERKDSKSKLGSHSQDDPVKKKKVERKKVTKRPANITDGSPFVDNSTNSTETPKQSISPVTNLGPKQQFENLIKGSEEAKGADASGTVERSLRYHSKNDDGRYFEQHIDFQSSQRSPTIIDACKALYHKCYKPAVPILVPCQNPPSLLGGFLGVFAYKDDSVSRVDFKDEISFSYPVSPDDWKNYEYVLMSMDEFGNLEWLQKDLWLKKIINDEQLCELKMKGRDASDDCNEY